MVGGIGVVGVTGVVGVDGVVFVVGGIGVFEKPFQKHRTTPSNENYINRAIKINIKP